MYLIFKHEAVHFRQVGQLSGLLTKPRSRPVFPLQMSSKPVFRAALTTLTKFRTRNTFKPSLLAASFACPKPENLPFSSPFFSSHLQFSLFSKPNSTKNNEMSAPTSFYDLAPLDKTGKPFEFSQLKGKVVLIVNVASKCGFTPQYEGLEKLYKQYEPQGLVIIGFPCNQFGHQEPGTDEEITSFCSLNYGVSFPILKKIDVNGPDADPVYKYLKSQQKGLLGIKGIKWNFEKFLIDKNGKVYDRYMSTKKPSSLAEKIEALLKA